LGKEFTTMPVQSARVRNFIGSPRAEIARAAIMLGQGRLQEAEKLVSQLQLPVIEPSLEASDVFRRLGDWAASEGRWNEAAIQFKRLNLAFVG
jgi:hypothetical protein